MIWENLLLAYLLVWRVLSCLRKEKILISYGKSIWQVNNFENRAWSQLRIISKNLNMHAIARHLNSAESSRIQGLDKLQLFWRQRRRRLQKRISMNNHQFVGYLCKIIILFLARRASHINVSYQRDSRIIIAIEMSPEISYSNWCTRLQLRLVEWQRRHVKGFITFTHSFIHSSLLSRSAISLIHQ